MVIGVSFLATPAKFAALSLTLPVALDVGRHTFGVFAPAEIGAAVIVTVLATLCGGRAVLASIALVGRIAVLQTVWHLPALDARVELILTGGTVPGSPLHDIHIALEGAKLLALLTVGAGPAFPTPSARGCSWRAPPPKIGHPIPKAGYARPIDDPPA